MTLLQVTFWTCAALVLYTYAAYPAVVWFLSRLFGRAPRPPAAHDGDLPTVTLLIAAHNEEAVIAARLDNALGADYPSDRYQVVVASDGSSDGTATVVSRYSDRHVRLLDYKTRRGKASVLNIAMAEVDCELVLLSDANTHLEPGAVRRLARWFADPAVGAVCGRLVLTDPATGANADGLYWKYETFLKKCESRLGALLGSNGAIYAIRRKSYVPIPGDTIVDDFVIPLLAKLRAGAEAVPGAATGYQIIYDDEAVATEETAPDVGAEFRRRARIGAGGFQAIVLLRRLLHPGQGWVAFTFFSHKVLRWLCPFFLIGLLLASVLLWEHRFYRYALSAQVTFYAASQIPEHLPTRLKFLKPLRLATLFTNMNLALLVGFCRWLRGAQKGSWERTARVAELSPAK